MSLIFMAGVFLLICSTAGLGYLFWITCKNVMWINLYIFGFNGMFSSCPFEASPDEEYDVDESENEIVDDWKEENRTNED